MIAVSGAVLLVAAIGVPHLLRFDRAPPGFAAAIWLSALMLRALASVVIVIGIEVYLPGDRLARDLSKHGVSMQAGRPSAATARWTSSWRCPRLRLPLRSHGC